MSSFLTTIYRRVGRISLRQLLLLCVLLIIVIVFVVRSQSDEATPTSDAVRSLPQVTLTSLQEQSATGNVSLIGTVRAASEAAITSEVSGRVTSVPVSLGATVQAGQVIATLENRSQQAAVTQAEGAYDAAVAAASQNQLGLKNTEQKLQNAKQQAVTVYRSSFNTVHDGFRNQIDSFYQQPNGISVPGVRISGYTDTLSEERIAFRSILENWHADADMITTADDLETALTGARTYTERTIALVDTFLKALDLSRNRDNPRYNIPQEKEAFTSLRTVLLNQLNSIANAKTAITSSLIQVEQARQTTTGSRNSSADAQIKQVLGSLQAAQANLAKTILRSPIAGTVTNLSVRTGDYTSPGMAVATVANTDTLEIVTFAGSTERNQFQVGDSVTLNESADGRVAAISPSIDPATGKTEIRIFTNSTELTNGDTVRVMSDTNNTPDNTATGPTFIPITAVKFTADQGAVFVVDADNRIREQRIELGSIRADQVAVLQGLEPTDRFIVDVRGLTEGTEVTVTN